MSLSIFNDVLKNNEPNEHANIITVSERSESNQVPTTHHGGSDERESGQDTTHTPSPTRYNNDIDELRDGLASIATAMAQLVKEVNVLKGKERGGNDASLSASTNNDPCTSLLSVQNSSLHHSDVSVNDENEKDEEKESENNNSNVSVFGSYLEDNKKEIKVNNNISALVEKFSKIKISHDEMKEYKTKYPLPDNIGLYSPDVNKEIWPGLPNYAQERDRKIKNIQKLTINGMAPIIYTTDTLVNLIDSHESMDRETLTTITKQLVDSLAMLTNANLSMLHMRREDIKPTLGYQAKEILCDMKNNPVTADGLFGDDLQGQLKKASENSRSKLALSNRFHPYAKPSSSLSYPSTSSNYRGSSRPFLGAGRGSWKPSHKNFQRGQKQFPQNKNRQQKQSNQ